MSLLLFLSTVSFCNLQREMTHLRIKSIAGVIFDDVDIEVVAKNKLKNNVKKQRFVFIFC